MAMLIKWLFCKATYSPTCNE